ncbi:MAG: hypothetical protein ACREHF_01200 [Rhizomicrobium sp.]
MTAVQSLIEKIHDLPPRRIKDVLAFVDSLLEASRNNTLYNCCTENREPDWRQYDGLRIDCCASFLSGDGSTWTKEVPLHEAEFFTVYARLTDDICCDAITDVSTYRLARRIAEMFKDKIGARCTLDDYCKVKSDIAAMHLCGPESRFSR